MNHTPPDQIGLSASDPDSQFADLAVVHPATASTDVLNPVGRPVFSTARAHPLSHPVRTYPRDNLVGPSAGTLGRLDL